MRAVVFHGIGDIRLDEVPEPKLREATDVIVKLTASAICGTDLHMVRGIMAGQEWKQEPPRSRMCGPHRRGEQRGSELRAGDRVIISSTITCGFNKAENNREELLQPVEEEKGLF